jgi:hypothetical protein
MSEPYARASDSAPYVAYAFEQITVSNSAVTFTAANSNGAKRVVCALEGAAIRYRSDGTNPTSAVGMPMNVGDQLVLVGPEIQATHFIAQAGNGTLDVEYSR